MAVMQLEFFTRMIKKNDLLISFSLLENPDELMVPTNHYSLSDPLTNLASPLSWQSH